MRSAALHLIQAGVENGDRDWLVKAAGGKRRGADWVVPKSAQVGDAVVIYIRGQGLFATALIATVPTPSPNWKGRFSATITDVDLIEPPVSLETIRLRVPGLAWARYPRSIHTPVPKMASAIRRLVARRRVDRHPGLDNRSLAVASLEELRAVALLKARSSLSPKQAAAVRRAGSDAIRRYALLRAGGVCESCGTDAPFVTPDGSSYLEVHHIFRRADGGADHPFKVIAVCPNCHRRAHHSADAKSFASKLRRQVEKIEAALWTER